MATMNASTKQANEFSCTLLCFIQIFEYQRALNFHTRIKLINPNCNFFAHCLFKFHTKMVNLAYLEVQNPILDVHFDKINSTIWRET